MTIISLTGLCGSGKDTVFEVIQEIVPHAERLAWADPGKEFICKQLGITREMLEIYKRGGEGHITVLGKQKSMRLFVQETMETFREMFGELFWTDMQMPFTFNHAGRVVVVTDTRFDHEGARVTTLSGHNVEVLAPSHTQHTGHHSDDGLSPHLVSHHIDNDNRDDDKASLRVQVRSILLELGVA